MKLVTFRSSDDQPPQVGVVTSSGVASATPASRLRDAEMTWIIKHWQDVRPELERWAAEGPVLPLDKVQLMAPISRPGKIPAIGLNYADHVAESGQSAPSAQAWFAKHTTSVNGPFDPIELPAASVFVDYEVELVAIVGKRVRHVSKSDAPDVIFGYCVGNDVSARDWQRKTPQWVLGKSFDTHAPFGPWITTADEVGDPHGLDIICKVNGEMRQSSNTRHLIFDVYDQIVELSSVMTLEPGDVIFTGTPSGVGGAMVPPRRLEPGDRVHCEIEKLGAIEGVMIPERTEPAV